MSARTLKPGHASGKRFLLGLGIGFLVLAVGLYVGLKGFIRHTQAQKSAPIALCWDQRDAWPSEPVLPFELEYDSMVQAETGKQYRNAVFSLAADPAQERRIEDALLACAARARDGQDFRTEDTRSFLEAQAAAFPGQFYPAYLLASWHGLRGETAAEEAWMAKAAATAPAFLCEDGHAPGKAIAPLAIAFDRLRVTPKAHPSFWDRLAHHTKEQILDRNLVLAYPAPKADAKGRVWLPVFRVMYRWADPGRANPAPADPHAAHDAKNKAWFSMDSTRVGRLNGPGAKAPKRP